VAFDILYLMKSYCSNGPCRERRPRLEALSGVSSSHAKASNRKPEETTRADPLFLTGEDDQPASSRGLILRLRFAYSPRRQLIALIPSARERGGKGNEASPCVRSAAPCSLNHKRKERARVWCAASPRVPASADAGRGHDLKQVE